ncbi:unnamed protein product [Psylliodes chrysocephalus]|uniref:Uncharacterized protein n=1 Tax=Psylliodes chrysocephalus TaxID=3402493 RepID=A0A9P0GJG0_9CUCU|nr:unnamed protein product [Psylliodes chrysocephala]
MKLTYNQVKTKIHGVPLQYIAELNKIKKSKSTGVSPDDLYTPKLWCFEMLGFLSDSAVITSRGESNLNLEAVLKDFKDVSQVYIEEEDTQQDEEDEICYQIYEKDVTEMDSKIILIRISVMFPFLFLFPYRDLPVLHPEHQL